MISFEEIGAMLDDIAENLPKEFFKELNGGINLLPYAKVHPESRDTCCLFIMGEYFNDCYGLGRYINIYYGSFIRIFDYLQPEQQREELRRILVHEITHHLESLGGERGLEVKDAYDLDMYRKRYRVGE